MPAALRDELRSALESLDRDRIVAAIRKVVAIDSEQGNALSRLADEFGYPDILKALATAAGLGRRS